jgi:hypothetical protein
MRKTTVLDSLTWIARLWGTTSLSLNWELANPMYKYRRIAEALK